VLAFPRLPLTENLDAQEPPSYVGIVRGLGYAIVFELIAAAAVFCGWVLWRHVR
jgi:hypothetical protein